MTFFNEKFNIKKIYSMFLGIGCIILIVFQKKINGYLFDSENNHLSNVVEDTVEVNNNQTNDQFLLYFMSALLFSSNFFMSYGILYGVN
jgi:hypothetical protein